MTKKQKSAKRSFISSVLVLCLCFTMFVGTTFAWYNDSVTSARNKIVAGSLEMVLEKYIGTDGDFSKTTNWETVTDQTKIFNETDGALTFEPGAVQVAYVRVKNAGDLAFKYSLAAKVYEEKAGTNQENQSFLLSDYLKFGKANASEPYATREAAISAVSANATKLKDATLSADGDYLAKGVNPVIVALVVYMPSDVGNVANPQPDKKPEISFGLNAIAAQYTIESDSFSNTYDASAVIPETVGDYASISTLLSSVSTTEPVTIQLTENITVPNDAQKSAITIPANANVTLDLNGKTISGSRTDQKPSYAMINVGMNSTLTIENGTVEYGDPGDGSWSAYRNTISVGRGTLVVKNATIINTCPTGISSAIDILTNTGPEDAKLIIEDSTVQSQRYGIRLFGNSPNGTAILEMKNTTVTAGSAALMLQQSQGGSNNTPIVATLTDSTLTAPRGVYLWDCNTVAGTSGEESINLILKGSTTMSATGTFSDKAAAIAAGADGNYPGYANQIIVDYSTGSGDTNFKVTDNR